MKKLILLLVITSKFSACCKSEDPVIAMRKDYINNHIKEEHNLGKSDSTFFELFFDKGSIPYLYADSIPIRFCPNSNDSISVSYSKNPLIKDEYKTIAYFKTNCNIKFLARSIYKIRTYTSGNASVLSEYGTIITPNTIKPLEIFNQVDLGYEDCLICYFFVTEDNCTHTGFSRIYVQH